MDTIQVKYKDTVYIYPKGITLLEISNNFKNEFKLDIIIGTIDNKLTELNTTVDKDCNINFFDATSTLGNRVYERGIVYLFIYAVRDLYNCDVNVDHSIDKGIYIELPIDKELDDKDIENLDKKMHELVDASIPYEKLSVTRLDAIDYYEKINQMEKARGLRYISNTFVNLYKLDNMYDYFYGEMPINTSPLKYFKLTLIKPHGIVLRFPNYFLKGEISDYINHDKLFTEFRNFHKWCDTINVKNIADLNNIISLKQDLDLIYLSEIEQNTRLYDIAKTINNNRNIKVILIAGPSSSGKTTTSKKLSLYLKSMGLKPYPLSTDDYFVDREKTPRNEKGEYDFESLDALNLDLFNQNLNSLLNGEEVLLPEFNFITGKSEFKNKRLKLLEKDILIIEGLHALNESLTSSINRENKYKIYLSPLTSLNIDNHNRITTSDNRLLRRMIRDNKYRGYSASSTLAKWKAVREGEEKYVFPYQDNADIIFNTSLIYELGVLRLYGEPLLFSVKEEDPNYGEAIRLINLLRNILPITSDSIPLDSIIREFIGESYFKE